MNSSDILLCSLIVLIVIPLITLTFFICRRLKELHNSNKIIEGQLFISDTGNIYSEFDIPISDMIKRDTILLKVNYVKVKKEDSKDV